MNVGPIEVETESAGRYKDVDQETLHRLVSQIGINNSYLIVHRAGEPNEFAKVAIETGRSSKAATFVVEFKDESGVQFQSKTQDLDQVRTALAGWAFEIPGWKNGLKWKRLRLNKVVNLVENCTFTQENDTWTAHFPFLGLSAVGRDKDEAFRELRTLIAETVNQGPRETKDAYAEFLAKNLIEISERELDLKIERERLSEEQQLRIVKSSGQLWPNDDAPRDMQ